MAVSASEWLETRRPNEARSTSCNADELTRAPVPMNVRSCPRAGKLQQLAFHLRSTRHKEEGHQVRRVLHRNADVAGHGAAIQEDVISNHRQVWLCVVDVNHLAACRALARGERPLCFQEDAVVHVLQHELLDVVVRAFPGIEPLEVGILDKLLRQLDPVRKILALEHVHHHHHARHDHHARHHPEHHYHQRHQPQASNCIHDDTPQDLVCANADWDALICGDDGQPRLPRKAVSGHEQRGALRGSGAGNVSPAVRCTTGPGRSQAATLSDDSARAWEPLGNTRRGLFLFAEAPTSP